MQGNPLVFGARSLWHLARRPRYAPRWIADLVTRRTPLDLGLPSFSWPSVEYLQTVLRPGQRLFEWGGGGSTIWAARLGCRVTVVESNREWYEKIMRHVESDLPADRRPEIRFVDAETGDATRAREYVDEVRRGSPWDVVFVDGIETPTVSRVACAQAAIDLVPPGGIIVFDDAWRDVYTEAPRVLSRFRRQVFRGLGPARLGMTQTDVYIRPDSNEPG